MTARMKATITDYSSWIYLVRGHHVAIKCV